MKTSDQHPADATADAPEKLLTTDAVAAWLGIQRCTLEKARSTRLGDFPPFIRIGRAVRYRQTDVEQWLLAHAFNTDGSRAHADNAKHQGQ